MKFYRMADIEDSQIMLNKKPPKFITILLMLLSIILISLSLWLILGSKDITISAQTVVTADKEVTNIIAPYSGKLVEVNDKNEVHKNEIILKIDNTEIDINHDNIDKQISNLNHMKNSLLELKSSIESEEIAFSDDIEQVYKDEYQQYINTKSALMIDSEVAQNDALRTAPSDSAIQSATAEYNALVEQINQLTDDKNTAANSIEQQQIDKQIDALQSHLTKAETMINVASNEYETQSNKALASSSDQAAQGEAKVKQYKQQTLTSIATRISEVDEQLKKIVLEKDKVIVNQDKAIIRADEDSFIQLKPNIHKDSVVEQGQTLASSLPKSANKEIILYVLPNDLHKIKDNKEVVVNYPQDNMVVKSNIVSIAHVPSEITTDTSKLVVYQVKVKPKQSLDKLDYGMVGEASIVVKKEKLYKYIYHKLFK